MIPVFYTPKMVAESGCDSPSAAKPTKVVKSWKSKFFIEIHEPEPVTAEDLYRAHEPVFVDGVLNCLEDNGFGNKSPEVAASLPYTSGAMLSAARHAIKTGKAAAAPCSGFHHACWDKCMGYCTFNGLMVAALALHQEGIKTVGILDLDMHYGNGTDDIITQLNLHLDRKVMHFTAGRTFLRPQQATSFFSDWLPSVLKQLAAACDVVLYQAGADPHIDDPHGGWLTTDQLRVRDGLVFEALADAKIPVAWNLAGGYQRDRDGGITKVLDIHDNTMNECDIYFGGSR